MYEYYFWWMLGFTASDFLNWAFDVGLLNFFKYIGCFEKNAIFECLQSLQSLRAIYLIMELTKEMRNCLIESLRRCDFKPQEIHDVLKTAWPNDSLCLQQVSKLYKEFWEGDRILYWILLLVKMEVADQKVREETKVLNKLEL